MPIKIENISEDVNIAPNIYSVRINDDLVACFTHDRELGLSECLLAASRACEGIKEKGKTNGHQ